MRHAGRDACTHPSLDLCALDPVQQCLRHAADLGRNRFHGGPHRGGFPAVFLHQAYCAFTDFGRELVGLIHGFIILRVEASTKSGAVQCGYYQVHEFALTSRSRRADKLRGPLSSTAPEKAVFGTIIERPLPGGEVTLVQVSAEQLHDAVSTSMSIMIYRTLGSTRRGAPLKSTFGDTKHGSNRPIRRA